MTDERDIVERLRETGIPGDRVWTACREAAAEIERLRRMEKGFAKAERAWLVPSNTVKWEGDMADAITAALAELAALRQRVQELEADSEVDQRLLEVMKQQAKILGMKYDGDQEFIITLRKRVQELEADAVKDIP